jgi:DNA-binding NarL/FixJ family response regulator
MVQIELRAMAEKRSRVLIVDDHPVVRMGLRAVLERSGLYEVCADAASAAEALDQAAKEQPELMILDLMLGNAGGPDLIGDILRFSPQTRILVLSQHDESLYAERALRAGARGYLMKDEAPDRLLAALDAIRRSEIVLSPQMNSRVIERHIRPQSGQDAAEGLSNRELQIFRLIGKGLNTGDIAAELNLSPKTVGAHRENIKTKLGLRTAAELERKAVLHVERHG